MPNSIDVTLYLGNDDAWHLLGTDGGGLFDIVFYLVAGSYDPITSGRSMFAWATQRLHRGYFSAGFHLQRAGDTTALPAAALRRDQLLDVAAQLAFALGAV